MYAEAQDFLYISIYIKRYKQLHTLEIILTLKWMLGLCIWLVLVTPIISLSTVAEDILFQLKEHLQSFKF